MLPSAHSLILIAMNVDRVGLTGQDEHGISDGNPTAGLVLDKGDHDHAYRSTCACVQAGEVGENALEEQFLEELFLL